MTPGGPPPSTDGLLRPGPTTDLAGQIRARRAATGVLLAALDDDPTGSQAVHGVQLVTTPDPELYPAALDTPSGTCFVLTNSRSLDESAAAQLNRRVGTDLLAVAEGLGRPLQLLSRSDSTLRGHVLAEIAALDAARRHRHGAGFDGVLFAPAYLEAGRVTADDIQWAHTATGVVPVGETEFARDRSFGYSASNLHDFLAEKSGGALRSMSITLEDIRDGGPERVREVLATARKGTWVVVNASEYRDLETVALAALAAEDDGQCFVFRTGPSFVRALAGLGASPPLRVHDVWPAGAPHGPGLVVVGSHVDQSSRQLSELREQRSVVDVELDVVALLDRGADAVLPAVAAAVRAGLAGDDVVLATSRSVLAGADASASLRIARTVSAALVRIVRDVLAAGPAWVVGKGGITSHDVAVSGLGIRRAEVLGQVFPGLVSVLRPLDAPEAVRGMPYVVFAGNVGDDDALVRVVDLLRGAEETR